MRGEAGERALRELRRERAPIVAVRRLLAPAIGSDLYDTFDLIMSMSEKRSLRSSFNFIPANTAGAIDGAYTLDDPNIRRLLTAIAERGHEIGFHPGYATFDDPERTRRTSSGSARSATSSASTSPSGAAVSTISVGGIRRRGRTGTAQVSITTRRSASQAGLDFAAVPATSTRFSTC